MKTAHLKLPIKQSALSKLLTEGGVTKAYIFGSYARGEQTAKSDLDLFITCRDGVSLFDVIDLQSKLQNQAGIPVDLVTKISPYFAEYIEPELIEIDL